VCCLFVVISVLVVLEMVGLSVHHFSHWTHFPRDLTVQIKVARQLVDVQF